MGNVEIIKGVYEAMEHRYWGTFKATGKSAATGTQACHVWGMRDGRIVRFQQYIDSAKMQDVMGVSATT